VRGSGGPHEAARQKLRVALGGPERRPRSTPINLRVSHAHGSARKLAPDDSGQAVGQTGPALRLSVRAVLPAHEERA
jgi:hypothetical protein